MICKCRRIEEYWNATGGSECGHFTRKDIIACLVIGSIPILGQLVSILCLIRAFIVSRNKERVPVEFRNIKRGRK